MKLGDIAFTAILSCGALALLGIDIYLGYQIVCFWIKKSNKNI